MKYPYKTRIGGASVTVLVPHERIDRGRFCINKAERERSLSCSLGAICRSIRCIDAITPRCDLVLDGVEPFANLESLQTILDAIPDTHSVYINTALPVSPEQPEQMILDLVEHNMQKIACLNISRPI